jgi:prepilin-type N-terminal cleavage/methylation domain-containing protein
MNFFTLQHSTTSDARRVYAFTLIEIMIVVAIMGLVLAMGVPSFVRALRKEGIYKASSDLMEACKQARSDAILKGQPAELVMHPVDGTFEVPGSFPLTQFPENVHIDILGVNFIQYENMDEAHVSFFPNGTSDEFTIVLTSDQHETRKISLDVVTALADLEVVR